MQAKQTDVGRMPAFYCVFVRCEKYFVLESHKYCFSCQFLLSAANAPPHRQAACPSPARFTPHAQYTHTHTHTHTHMHMYSTCTHTHPPSFPACSDGGEGGMGAPLQLWLSVSAAQHHVSSLPAGVACLVLLTLVLGLLLIVATLVLSQCPGGAQQCPR